MGDRTNDPGSERPLLVLVGSGDRRYREYILAALHRHFRLWLLDRVVPTWHQPYLTGFTHTDTRDPQALVRAARAIPVGQGPVAGMLSYDEWLLEATAAAAEQLGLPGSPAHAVAACRDKATTRSRLAAAGVPQPRSVLVGSLAEATAAADRIGYPVVVKARRLAGSIGVRRADEPVALTEAYREADAAVFPTVNRSSAEVLVEEYLDGPEISIDSAVDAGRAFPLALARKRTGLEPYFEETGHLVDAADPLLDDGAILDQLSRVHQAIGITQGMTHTEFRLTSRGPRLVEINARLGGDFIPYLGHLATGIDLAIVAGQLATGKSPSLTAAYGKVSGIRFLYPPADCRVVDIQVHSSRFTAFTHAAVSTVQPEQEMRLPPAGFLSRYGYLIAIGDSVEQVEKELDQAQAVIELQYVPL